jgi:Carboxypeptidase regulatory-like domain
MKHFAVGASAWLLLVMSVNALGQATTTLSGTVQDASGALIPGVEITAINDATSVATMTLTNDSGVYNFAALPPGTYTVRASLPSFQTRTFTQVALSANQTNRLNFVLEVSAQASAVEVTASAEQLLLESSPSVGDLLTKREIDALPNVTNNVLEFVNVMAGVTRRRDAFALGIQGDFAGVSASNVNVVRDGISVNDERWVSAGLNSATYLNQDMVAEMRMILAPVDAETGRGNGQVQITTRSGSNEFHGAAVWNARNSALDARTWVDNRTLGGPPTVPWINQNQYTVSAGGPIVKNRTFFYTLWDHNISHSRSTVMGQVLSPCMQKGIFRYYDNWNNGPANAATNAGGINPVRAAVDALGNPLPPATNPDGSPHNGILRYVSLFGQVSGTPSPDCSGMAVTPAPTASGTWDPNRRGFDSSGVYDFLASRAPKANTWEPIGGSFIPLDGLNIVGHRWTRTVDGRDNLWGVGEPNPRKQINVKIDHVFSMRHRVATAYTYETVNADDTYEGWPDSFEGRVQRRPQVLSLNLASTLSHNIVNEGRFGMTRMGTNVLHATSVPANKEKLLELLPKGPGGLPILTQWCAPAATFFAPSPIGWCGENGGLIGARGDGPSAADTIDSSPRWTIADTLSWTLGRHSYKFGASFVKATSKSIVSGSSILDHSYPVTFLGAAPLAPNNAFDRGNATGFRALNPQLDPGLVTANSDRMRDLLLFLSGSLGRIEQGRFINRPDQVGKNWNDPLKGEINQVRDLQQHEFNVFLKDDWKVTNRLTLNLGLRWDYYGVPYDKNGMAMTIVGGGANLFGRSGSGFENWLRPGERGKDVEFIFVGPNSPNPDLSVYKRDLNNFGPAVGFSYNVPWLGRDRTVFRGGYQLSYLVTQAEIIGPIIQNAPGSAVQGLFTGPNGGQYFNMKDAIAGLGIPTEPSARPVQPVPVSDRTVNLTVFDPNYTTPYIQNLTASLTHTFTSKFSLDVRYIGTLSRKLGNSFDINAQNIFQNGLFQAFEAARAGGESELLDRIFRGIDMRTNAAAAPQIVGQNGLTGAGLLRTDTRFNTNLAQGNYLGTTSLANTINTINYVSAFNPNLPGVTDANNRGNVLRSNGFPENFIVTSPQFGQAILRTNMGYRNYHSMQTEFTIRPTYGIQNSFSYIWAKDLGNSTGGGSVFTSTYTVPWDRAQDYRIGTNSREHTLRSYGTYSLPIGPGQPLLRNSTGVLARAVEGWQISWIYNWVSGTPIQATSQRSGWYGSTLNNNEAILVDPALFDPRSGKVRWDKDARYGSYFGPYGNYVTGRDPQCTNPAVVAASLQSLCTLNAVYDQSGRLVFRTPRPGEFSNFRDQIFGPGDWDLDMAVSKRLRINERMNMEIRVDGNNILNHAKPSNPNLNIQGGTPVTPFGTIERKSGVAVQNASYGRVFQGRLRLTW